MTDQAELPFVHGTQLVFDRFGPKAGDRYRNRNTGTICAVLGIEQHRSAWVTVRIFGETQTLTLATFEKQFERI